MQRNAHATAHGLLWGLFYYFRNMTVKCRKHIINHGEIEQSTEVW